MPPPGKKTPVKAVRDRACIGVLSLLCHEVHGKPRDVKIQVGNVWFALLFFKSSGNHMHSLTLEIGDCPIQEVCPESNVTVCAA